MMDRKAFTLVEIVVVGAVISLMAAGIAAVTVMKARETALENICAEARRRIQHAEEQYALGEGAHSTGLQDLVDAGYLRAVPACPSGGVYAWENTTPGDPLYQSAIVCSIHGAVEPPAVLGADDFNDGSADGWSLYKGKRWAVDDGKLLGGKEKGRVNKNWAFFGDEGWEDYTVSVDAELLAGHGYGLFVRATDLKKVDGYSVKYDQQNGVFSVTEYTNGRESKPLASYSPPAGYDWGGEKTLTVGVSGDTIQVSVSDIAGGGQPVLTVTDPTYSHGAVGLSTWKKGYASFDNVTVTEQ